MDRWEYLNGKPVWQQLGKFDIGNLSAALRRVKQSLIQLPRQFIKAQARDWVSHSFEVLGTGFVWKSDPSRARPIQFQFTKKADSNDVALHFTSRYDYLHEDHSHCLMWAPGGWCSPSELRHLAQELVTTTHPHRRDLLVALIQRKAQAHPNKIGEMVTSISISPPQLPPRRSGIALVGCHCKAPPLSVIELTEGPLLTAVEYFPWLISPTVVCAPAIRAHGGVMQFSGGQYRITLGTPKEGAMTRWGISGQRRRGCP